MKKTITLTLLCLLSVVSIFAQDLLERNCGAMENLEFRKQQDPNLEARMQQIETFTENKIQEMQTNRIDGNIITIPVVVHVLYRNSTENISVAQIQSQLDVLNEDFRRTNPDADNAWSQASDSEIEFCLVTVDPNGNATTGITRKSTTRRDWGTTDDMKRSSTGGVDPWNTSEYLNMWIVPQMLSNGGTILGYAQFPGGNAATDGVVMGYNYFGRTGNVSAPFDGGRTTTHEVGHYFNLRHIWGDANCGNDFVSDTPTHQASNGGCPVGQVSCGSTDMVQNYMDYTNDSCMNLFTLGQKNRMRAVLASGGARRSLALSDKCGAVTQPTCTDGIQNGNETGVDCGGSCTPCQTGNQYCASQGNSIADEYISRVQVGTINKGSGAQTYSDFTSTSTDLNKGSNYTLTVTPTWTGTTYSEGYAAWIDYNDDGDFTDAGEQVLTIAATQTTPVSGTFTVPAGTADGDKRLRVSMKYDGVPTSCELFPYGEVEDYTVTIKSVSTPTGCTGAISSFPYNEGFESGFGAWTQATGDDFNWTRTSGATPSSNTGPSSANEGSQYVFMESSAPNFSTKRSILVSPCFNLSGQNQATFNFKYHMYGASAMGNLKLAVSTDNGSSWTTVWTKSGNQGNSWQDATIDLSTYVNSNVKLRFDGTTGTTWQGDMAVDAISLTNGSTDKCAGVSPYDGSQSYSAGDRVTFQGSLYERTTSGWTNLGACGTARINDEGFVQHLDVEISVYPNPVKGNELFVKSNIENLVFTIVNMLGQEVVKGTSANSIDVGNLEAGLYLIQFRINDQFETLKFIKQ
ncbi:T9SS type A sorting domain-containing protein [Psychroserpens burtonensis]|uniref:T9SS type A sorting domain-containing protein n=1 Tax=Psychroserpens burtonensis TaxID=49278 RepID=A0A5C7BBB0_9FLAO|nr:GEVED domain-containing protein [Psychroserpens burtonensis]TXE19029.1 T9SS type A sorting domain-containing protein [Psychroserpens burtonensis]